MICPRLDHHFKGVENPVGSKSNPTEHRKGSCEGRSDGQRRLKELVSTSNSHLIVALWSFRNCRNPMASIAKVTSRPISFAT